MTQELGKSNRFFPRNPVWKEATARIAGTTVISISSGFDIVPRIPKNAMQKCRDTSKMQMSQCFH